VRAPEALSGLYFAYILVLAWTLRLPARRRWRISAAAVLMEGIIFASRAVPAMPLQAHAWVPILYLLTAYKVSGLFFVRPMPRFERALAACDRWLFEAIRFDAAAARAPRALLEYLEATYLITPLLVPLALLVPLQAGDADAVDTFWTLVLAVEFVCFGALPWVQTRPPWLLEPPGALERRRLTLRRLNRVVVDRALMPVNTFPSGHAASTLAIALAVVPLAPPAGAVLLVLAISIAIASVAGRYHYWPDAAAGVAVTLIAWAVLR
jgi:hypothetical protein